MMASNPLLQRYSTFNPDLGGHNDKRNIKRARDELEALVAKCHNKLGVPAFAGIPIMDPKRGVVGVEVFALTKSLTDFFENEENKTLLMEACEVSMVEILEGANNKNHGTTDGALDVAQNASVNHSKLAKPDKPVFAMNSKEMDSYFGQLKSSLAIRDGVKIVRKWAKKDGDQILEPTKLPAFDDFVESVLPSKEYFGSSKKFERGKLHWRMQLVSAYLLTKNDCDYNTYAKTVPTDYVAKNWNIEDLINMGGNPIDAARNNKQKRKRKDRYTSIADHVAHELNSPTTEDTEENDENEVNINEAPLETEIVDPTELLANEGSPEEHNNSVKSQNSLFSGSHASNEDDEKEDSEDEAHMVWLSEKNDIIDEMIAEENDLFKFITGQSKNEEYTYQVLGVKYVEKAEGYRALLSDSKSLYAKVFFNSKLSPLVKKLLCNDNKCIIKINQHRLFNNAVIIIDSFRDHWDSKNNILGHPKEIEKAAIHAVLSNPDESYASSPGLFQSKVTSRKPGKLKKNVGQ